MSNANRTLRRLSKFAALVSPSCSALLPAPFALERAEHENTVDVLLTEYQIDMPTTLEAGWTSLRIKNMGKKEHSFRIEGHDLEKKPGESATLQVDLRPGTYRVSCPEDDHDDDKNMKLELRVGRF